MASILPTLKFIFEVPKEKCFDQNLVMLSLVTRKQVPKTCVYALKYFCSLYVVRLHTGVRQEEYNAFLIVK